MYMAYCSNCRKETGHKRCLGFGTFFAVILTGGLWLIAILFYPERCIICGSSKIKPKVGNTKGEERWRRW